MADNNKTPYELRWEILREMVQLTKDEWYNKREIAQYNAEKSGKPLEYIGDIPLSDALARAERVYQEFVCKK
jgi:hypothetical protein